jgi:hypothetical protein
VLYKSTSAPLTRIAKFHPEGKTTKHSPSSLTNFVYSIEVLLVKFEDLFSQIQMFILRVREAARYTGESSQFFLPLAHVFDKLSLNLED